MHGKIKDLVKSKNVRDRFLIFVIGAIIYYWIVVVIFRRGGDDRNFVTQSADYSALGWVAMRYMTRSGRLFSELCIWIFARLPLSAFKAVDLLMHILLAEIFYSFAVLFGNPKTKLTSIVCIFAPFLMNIGAYVDGSMWVTGSMNYLWVAVPGFLGIYLIVRYCAFSEEKESGKGSFFITLVMILTAATSSEQIAVLILVLLLAGCLLLYKTEKFMALCIWFAAGFIGFLTCVIFCPGVKQRRADELNRYIKNFDTAPVRLRLEYKIRWCFDAVVGHLGWILVILLLLAAIYYISRKKTDWLFVPAIGIILLVLKDKFEMFFDFDATWGFTEFSQFTYFNLFLWAFLGSVIVVTMIKAFWQGDHNYENAVPLILTAALLLQVIGITASPTMYESGCRVMYHPALTLIILILYVLPRLKNTEGIKYIYLQITMLLVGIYRYADILSTMKDGFFFHLPW